jgi:hypothetical protein
MSNTNDNTNNRIKIHMTGEQRYTLRANFNKEDTQNWEMRIEIILN